MCCFLAFLSFISPVLLTTSGVLGWLSSPFYSSAKKKNWDKANRLRSQIFFQDLVENMAKANRKTKAELMLDFTR